MSNTAEDRVYGMEELQEIGTDMLRHVVEICERENIHYCLFFGSMLGAVRHHGPIPWDYDIDIAVHEDELNRFLAAMERELPKKYWVDFRSSLDSPKCFPRIGLAGYDTHSLHIDVYRMVGFPDSLKKSKAIVKYGRLLLEMKLVKNADLANYSGKKKKKIKSLRKLLVFTSPEFITKRFDALCRRYPFAKCNKVGLNACKGGIRYIYDREMIQDTILVDYLDFQVRIPREYDRILRSFYGDYMKPPRQELIDAEMNREYRIRALR